MVLVKKPELLSPAGNMDCVRAAVNNGADAIYLGGQQFSARQHANNFSIEEIEKAVDYCHLKDVKVYVTINTIYKDKEIKDVLNFVKQLYEIGVDAVILQDIGVASLIHKNFPSLKIHGSTQLTTNSVNDVLALEEQGFSKIVLSRELNIKEIEEIIEKSNVEIETFVHGALCVSYSGQCIISSMLGGRSGNRGRCAQTCRLPFSLYEGYKKVEEGHLLSLKDIETVSILPTLIDAGINSFKIEGRMKNAEYVAGVTRIYRKYIDLYFEDKENYKVSQEDIKELLQLFNRGGFTQGYYETHSGLDMMSPIRPKTWGVKLGFVDSYDKKSGRATIRTQEKLVPGDGIEIWTEKEPHVGTNINKASKPGEVINIALRGEVSKNNVVYKTNNKALIDELKKTYEKETRRQKINGKFVFMLDKPMELTLWDSKGNIAEVTGEKVEVAQNQPMSAEKIKDQLCKTGGTSFEIENLELVGDENVYIPVSLLNQLRRNAIEVLEEKIILAYKKKNTEIILKPSVNDKQFIYNKKLNVQVQSFLQFQGAISCDNINIIYFEMNDDFMENYEECIKECKKLGIKLYVALPRVYRGISEKIFGKFINVIKESEVDGFLVRSLGQLKEVKETGKEIGIDFNLNTFNTEDVLFWKEKGADIISVSPELNLNEINLMAEESCEMVVYGHLPLMTTHQCPVGSFMGKKENTMYCDLKGSSETYYLKDRKNEEFPLLTDCKQCVCTVLNGKPLFTLKFFDEIIASSTGSMRLVFTIEKAEEVRNIIDAYGDCVEEWVDKSTRANRLITIMSEKGSTKGHYFRGIE